MPLTVLVLLNDWLPSFNFPYLNIQRVSVFIVLSVISIGVLLSKPFDVFGSDLLVIGLWGWLVVTALCSVSPVRGLQETGFYGLLLMGYWGVRQSCFCLTAAAIKQALRVVVALIITTYSVALLPVLIEYFEGLLLANKSAAWFPEFENVRLFNHLQVWFIPLGGWVLWSLKYSPQRILYVLAYLSLIVWWQALFYSMGRGVLLSLLVAAVMTFCFVRDGEKGPVLLVLKNFLVASLVYFVVFVLIPYWVSGSLPYSYLERAVGQHTGGRSALWVLAVNLMAENIVLGVGPQLYGLASTHYTSPHNMLLLYGAEAGLPAFFLCVFLYGRLTSFYWKIRCERLTALQFVFVWQGLAVMSYSMFTGLFLSPLSQASLVFFAAIQWWCFSRYRLPSGNSSPSRLPVVVLVVVAIFGGYITISDMIYLESVINADELKISYPRFWRNGHMYDW